MLFFRGENSELSAGAPVRMNFKLWQELMLHLTWNHVHAGKKGTEWERGKDQTYSIFQRAGLLTGQPGLRKQRALRLWWL